MNIGIFYICIGKYSCFFEEFYESAIKHLFKNDRKHFYVFTDNKEMIESNSFDNVSFIYFEDLGWPYNTLLRFKMFMTVKEDIKKYDYVYFFNANAMFVKDIDKCIIPTKGDIIVAKHFKYVNTKDKYEYPLDRNKKCWANVNWGEEGKHYIQACFFGATGKEFYNISNILSNEIDKDISKNIIAIWHDESYLNKYIINKEYTILDVSYVYPESLKLNYEINILMRNKERYFPLDSLRKQNTFVLNKIKVKISNQKPKVDIFVAKLLRKIGIYG
ncbi:MAG: hypothetical protein MR601_05010 [Erysipelotrichaceae bacterium]|nr:hypothetical protein [Erysipelotrichaceae bacterium]